MPTQDIGKVTVSDLTNLVPDYSVDYEHTDGVSTQPETEYTNTRWPQQLAYFNKIPQLNKAISALAMWTAGKGYTCDTGTKVMLDQINGWGEDTFSAIMMNMSRVAMYGRDAYAEVVRADDGTLINLKVLDTGSIKHVVGSNGVLIRYEQISKTPNQVPKKFKPEKIFHICNDRNADSIHGSSVADLCEWVILAKQEAMRDWKRISHRSSIRVLYVDEDNPAQLTLIKAQYAAGIKSGEILVIPAKKGEAEFGELTLPPIDAYLRWMEYLDNLFYTIVGVPKVIATSENYTESSSKMSVFTFEPVYSHKQVQLENDLWAQLGIKVTFNRPPSLSEGQKADEAKDPSDIQPSDTTAGVGR